MTSLATVFVTGLIVHRTVNTSEDRISSINGKLWSIIFIIIESEMEMLSIQLVRVVLDIIGSDTINFVIGINQMLNVELECDYSISHFVFHFTEIICRD